jgi:hypothetical protein
LEVSSSKLNFQISMVEVDELKPHEEVIDSIVRKLADEVTREEKLRDPLIVDREYHIILDGMHRFNSLKQLKCRFIPCCLVDYDSPLIKVGSWFRLFRVEKEDVTAEELLREAKLNYSKQHVDLENFDYAGQTVIITRSGQEFLLPDPMDLIQRSRTAVALEKAMVRRGYAVKYLSEIIAIKELKNAGDSNFVIVLPIFTKPQIRDFGLTGQLLPHKVTRHVIPSRPLEIDVPLQMLTERKTSLEEANRKLGELLAQRHINRKPAGSMVEGRRYEEELLIFAP